MSYRLIATNTTSIENEEFEKLRWTNRKEGKVLYCHSLCFRKLLTLFSPQFQKIVNVYNLGALANFKSVFGQHVLWYYSWSVYAFNTYQTLGGGFQMSAKGTEYLLKEIIEGM